MPIENTPQPTLSEIHLAAREQYDPVYDIGTYIVEDEFFSPASSKRLEVPIEPNRRRSSFGGIASAGALPPRLGVAGHFAASASPALDVVSQIRDVSSSPTPLELFLTDPVVIDTLAARRSRSRSKHHRTERHHPHDAARRPHSPSVSRPSSVMSAILLEQECQARHFKSVISGASDRLESEIRRADQAEMSMRFAELRAKEVEGRVTAERAHAETEERRWKGECETWRIRSQERERELSRVREEIKALDRRREEAEEEMGRLLTQTQKLEFMLRERQVLMEEREENQKQAKERWLEKGRNEGWQAGYEKGMVDGRDEGFEEGRRLGRKEERQNALAAFDRFLDDEARNAYHDRNGVSDFPSLCMTSLIILEECRAGKTMGSRQRRVFARHLVFIEGAITA
jgi:hypothetical protein